jgi:photosystem II stability/assembly factor-like uncharacterized protein
MTNHQSSLNDAVYNLTASPDYSNDQILFAARGSGLYRSVNGGRTWDFALDSLDLAAPLAISCVALAPNFAVMPHVFAAGPGGILRSRDGGQSWYVSMLPPPSPFITSLSVSPNYTKDGIVFATTLDDGVFRSSNRGINWTAWNFGLFDMHVLSIAVSPKFAEDKNVFLGTESGIFRSVNGGLGWRELDFKIADAPVLSLAISPNFVDDRLLFAGTERSGLFRSQNGGASWELVASFDQVGSVESILLSDNFAETSYMLVANGEKLIQSKDGGQTWTSWRSDLKFKGHLLGLCAPKGLYPKADLVAGFANGEILTIQ